jgi:hypothetical protein
MSDANDTTDPAPKGHWPKGKPRNLPAGRVAAAKGIVRLLRVAVERPWRHPTLGVLSYRVVGAQLGVDGRTVHRWCGGERMPPLWALDEIKVLLAAFKE